MFQFFPGSKEAFLGPNSAKPVSNMPHAQPGFVAPMPAWLQNYQMPKMPVQKSPRELMMEQRAMRQANPNEMLARELEAWGGA